MATDESSRYLKVSKVCNLPLTSSPVDLTDLDPASEPAPPAEHSRRKVLQIRNMTNLVPHTADYANYEPLLSRAMRVLNSALRYTRDDDK